MTDRHNLTIERAAIPVYQAMPYDGEGSKPGWVPFGNSEKQDQARSIARAVLDAARISHLEPDQRRQAVARVMTLYAAGYDSLAAEGIKNNPYDFIPCAVVTNQESAEMFRYVAGLLLGEPAVSVPEGWKLIKTSTHTERSFLDDSEHYSCKCGDCGRMFSGLKSRHQCRVCEAEPPVMNPADIERSRAEAMAIVDRMMAEPFPKGE